MALVTSDNRGLRLAARYATLILVALIFLFPLAVALVIDHLFEVVRLHRVEIAIRPENTNSLRVVEKLGLREVGYAPKYLHIDGDWRDHRLYALTREELGARSLVSRLRAEA